MHAIFLASLIIYSFLCESVTSFDNLVALKENVFLVA